jgi:prepilin-type processing-associated H-X9-DG protein
VFLSGNGFGDTVDNGLFHNLTDGTTKSKLSVNDGASTTIMMSENSTKDPYYYSWLGVAANAVGEAQLGMVWVVAASPTVGNGLDQQEKISQSSAVSFDPTLPRFARPASNHSTGAVNVVFVDGHTMSLQPSIDYVVYQQLLTPNGRKCVNPEDWNDTGAAITAFRTAPPLSEKDFAE